ncbi:hypothetical protein ES703_113313 [subsurface metagenome]
MTPQNRTIDKCNTFNRQVNPLRLAWVDLLNRYNWDWFATLTFRDLPKSFTAVNRVKKWLMAIQKDEKRAIGYFMATEWFKTRECPHFHLLMGNLEGVRRDKWWSTWYTWYGRARILPYDKGLGAGYYLTKYVVKDVYQSGMFEIGGLQGDRQLKLRGVLKIYP